MRPSGITKRGKRSTFRWRDYILAYAHGVYEDRSGAELRINCPVCGEDRQRLSIRTDWGWAHCYNESCDPDPVGLVVSLEGLGVREALERVVEFSDDAPSLDRTLEEVLSDKRDKQQPGGMGLGRHDGANQAAGVGGGASEHLLPPATQPPVYPLDVRCRAYLRERQVGAAIVRRFGLATAGGFRFGGRLFVPVLSRGVAASYQCRAVDGSKPKYLFPKDGANVRDLLYNYDSVSGWVVVVEGVFDLWAVWECATENVVASFGKGITAAQRSLLLDPKIDGIILMQDPDAWKHTLALARELSSYKPVKLVSLAGGDPADSRHKLGQALDHAIPYDPSRHLEFLVRPHQY